MKIPFELYIVSNNPRAVAELLNKYGIPAPKNDADSIRKLQYAMKKFKGAIVDDLKAIDTDYKSLILSGAKELKSGACGCSGFDGNDSYNNCDGGGCKCESAKSNIQGSQPVRDFHDYKTSNVTGDGVEVKKEDKVDKTLSDFNKYAPAVIAVSALVIAVAFIVKK